MKLKYYLRGVGIGVFFTTLILMISISVHKDDFKQENIRQQETDAKTVAQAETETAQASRESAAGGETEAAGTDDADTETVSQTKTGNATDKTGLETEAAEKPDASKDSETKKTAQSSGKAEEKVRFEIGGGEYSDVTCRRLQEAGIIDDAEAFNKYLIQKDYDNLILPGVYDIPKGAAYEEIAALLTTKVEEETAQ